jgi:hypothetical protein
MTAEATLDIFDEQKQSYYTEPGSDYTYGAWVENNYDDDMDEDVTSEDIFGDEDSDEDEDESEDKKIMRGMFYSLGGVAVLGT